jgi:hypothetical protein
VCAGDAALRHQTALDPDLSMVPLHRTFRKNVRKALEQFEAREHDMHLTLTKGLPRRHPILDID